MDTFRVRLNCIDYYQATPTEFDPPVPHGASSAGPEDRHRVPVIRVFGSTETGQRVLMHVHGAFQYCYIEYSGSLVEKEVGLAIKTLQSAIDQALALSYRKDLVTGKHAYVAFISLVKGIPFYGFSVGYKFYLKIYLLNPLHMTRLADLLREGAVMKRVLQPYESHMQYLAQWMCDYNLFGCAYMDCKKVKFRPPVPECPEIESGSQNWHDGSIPPEFISDGDVLRKQSHCSLEIDVHVQHIMNRKGLKPRLLHHDFIEKDSPLPTDAILVPSMAELWKDETRRRKARLDITDPGSSPFGPEALVSMSAGLRNNSPSGWIHEEEYRQKLEQIASDEQQKSGQLDLNMDNFVKNISFQMTVNTALESVEDLYPDQLSAAKNFERDHHIPQAEEMPDQDQLVDEARVGKLRDGTVLNSSGEFSSRYEERCSSAENRKGSTASPLSSSSPIEPADFERLGIRQAGDFSHVAEDAFIAPDERTISLDNSAEPQKACSPPASVCIEPRRKRRRLLVDSEHGLPSFYDDEYSSITAGDSAECFPSGQRPEARSENESEPVVGTPTLQSNQDHQRAKGLLDSKFGFPVVKDPNDPNTLMRLSQNSNSSTKFSQEHQNGLENRLSSTQSSPLKSSATASDKTIRPTIPMTPFPTLTAVPRGIAAPGTNTKSFVFSKQCPSFTDVRASMAKGGLPDVIYQNAYYSDENDIPDRPRDYAGREFKLESTTVSYLPEFDPSGTAPSNFGQKAPVNLDRNLEEKTDCRQRKLCKITEWTIADLPPARADVLTWLKEETDSVVTSTSNTKAEQAKPKVLSQIDGPTQKNVHGFKYTQKGASSSVQHETQYMSLMSLEVHVNTRGHLAPDPAHDAVACIFWCVQSDDDENFETNAQQENRHTGILVHDASGLVGRNMSRDSAVEVETVSSEVDLLTTITDIVRRYDPDILTGYEVHNTSWGYLIERARRIYEMDLCDELSRMKSQSHGRFGKEEDRWGFNQTSTIRVTGRHTINIWRAMRGELDLLQYTMENVAFHVLHRRIPHYKFIDLTAWYTSNIARHLCKTVEYYVSRVQMDLDILEANELVSRTSEQARLLGVDWYSVISRGSQFKVESLMFRIAKPENFILISPSRRQVGGQNALECLPLVMEPQSDFYTSPVLVLDFQSLYPSVMIAYNYCYSTFLGRVINWRGTNKMGFTEYKREKQLISVLKDEVNIAPNGIMYAKNKIRRSLLAKMLKEILETRVMVKSGMKVDKHDKTLQRLLNNRQLALKLIANVTYGYTSASFSGRMPCSEIADSIVQTGRETLERAIAMIHAEEKWGAEVVYGDTDSLFVHLKGRTKDQAFDIGEQIAATITRANPRPIKLKFEKVYHPCILLAKKRYVGFKYESRDQKVPDFDAKGIETVRRDGTPAEQKIEEKALKILFKTADLSQVKSFFQSQCTKVMQGKVSIQDFCFAKEVRLGTYSDKGPPPPGALISARRMIQDPRTEPQYGERVPYVVVTGAPGARLIDRCVAPEALLQDSQLELDSEYYISKNLIPPLERIFNLVGANVRQWYDEMPKIQRIRRVDGLETSHGHGGGGVGTGAMGNAISKKTLESYMKSSSCIACREPLTVDSQDISSTPLCPSCTSQPAHVTLQLQSRLTRAERKVAQLHSVCRSCAGAGLATLDSEVKCDSKDCPVFYSRTRRGADLKWVRAVVGEVLRGLEERVEQGEGELGW